jgi:hypothetical protein
MHCVEPGGVMQTALPLNDVPSDYDSADLTQRVYILRPTISWGSVMASNDRLFGAFVVTAGAVSTIMVMFAVLAF